NVEDDSVEEYLKIYTLLDRDEVEKLMNEFQDNEDMRIAQKKLAYEVTKTVHGISQANSAVKVTEILFESSDYSGLNTDEIDLLKDAFVSVEAKEGDHLIEILTAGNMASSKGEARRLLEQKAIKLNGETIEADYAIKDTDKIAQNSAVLKKGKNNFAVITL
ncbi:MAG: S4 domain-containing protein, partial [Candidatus Saccharimonadales bacterium]